MDQNLIKSSGKGIHKKIFSKENHIFYCCGNGANNRTSLIIINDDIYSDTLKNSDFFQFSPNSSMNNLHLQQTEHVAAAMPKDTRGIIERKADCHVCSCVRCHLPNRKR